MSDPLDVPQNFDSLSVKDLLAARDLYHYHLVHKRNVIGTAVGRYLIRKEDEWPSEHDPKADSRARSGRPRRFEDSEVRRYSWPCVLVLVSKWEEEDAFGPGKLHPSQMIPKALYLPDGRVVPVCVVEVTPAEAEPLSMPSWQWPDTLLGGGLPISVEAQGVERSGTIGCLVSDGHTTYALTSRHVAGCPGDEVFATVHNKRVRVGLATDKQRTRMLFQDVYTDFLSKRTYLNLDVALVAIDDVNDWTSQIYGVGEIGALADVSEQNLTLHLIDAEVVAHGGASGALHGRIKGLFYRYKTVGGYEYVADFLIGPDESDPAAVQTQQGDSGTVWNLVPDENNTRPRPLAIEWGGQVFAAVGGHRTFALATSLSNVCKLLDVELVKDHNTGVQPYWGQMGHYSIASFACARVQTQALKDLMTRNMDRISFTLAELDPKKISAALKEAKKEKGFIPLADVPDMVWKALPTKIKGGRDRPAGKRTTGPEHPTHFADIDQPRKSDKKTLRELSVKTPTQHLTVAFWQSFYTDLGHTEFNERGLLPFRVWQFFDEMVDAAEKGDVARFVCAAGIVAHYVGDACQPLHGSMYADGYADQEIVTHHEHRDGTPYTEKSHVGAGVHSAYESNMVDRHADKLIKKIRAKNNKSYPAVKTGRAIAHAVVSLMERSASLVPPTDIVDEYIDAGGDKTVKVYDALWKRFGDQTAEMMADGAAVLAQVWESAWTEGHGHKIAAADLKAVATTDLMAHYTNPKFVQSLDLDHIGAVLKQPST
jgi:hypothetical protein